MAIPSHGLAAPQGARRTPGARRGDAEATAPRTPLITARSLVLIAFSLVDLAVVLAWLRNPALFRAPGLWLILRAGWAALAAFVVRRVSPDQNDSADPRWLTLATALWCFTVPIFGPAIACVTTWTAGPSKAGENEARWRRWPLPARWDDPALKIAPPALQETPEAIADDLSLTDRAHDGRRFHALLRAARLPLRFQVPLARSALSDANEDVRLYAFNLIDRQRREHDRAVQGARTLLDQAPTPGARALANLRLAEAAWEGAYQGLQEGSGVREALTVALEHVDRALVLGVADPSAYALRGRILLRLGHPDAAEEAFRAAIDGGVPDAKLLPYLAEAAYQRRRFDDVRDALARSRSGEDAEAPVAAGLRPVLEYWL